MSADNHSLVRTILNEVKKGLGPYIIETFAEHFGRNQNAHLKSLKRALSSERAYRSLEFENDEDAKSKIDIAGWLKVMRLRWDTVFKDKLGEDADSQDINVLNARSYLRELIEGRNKWGHETDENPISAQDVIRIAGTATRMLSAVGAENDASATHDHLVKFIKTNAEAIAEGESENERKNNRVDLTGLNLSDMNLYGRNLHLAKLRGADLSSSMLYSENLADIDLSDVKLVKANLSNARLANSNFVRADLSEAILRNADLEGANLSHTTLEKADLRSAKYDNSNFYFANLTGADLSNPKEKIDPTVSTFAMHYADFNALEDEWERYSVNFSRAILREANMQCIWLLGAEFSGANLTKAKLDFARMVHVSLEGAILESADLSHCDFLDCLISGTRMQGVIMRGGICLSSIVSFTNAEMSGANFESFTCSADDEQDSLFSAENADLSRANLNNARLAGSLLRNVNLTDATLVDIKLERSDLTYSILTRAKFENASLVEANLSYTDLNETDFSGADLSCADFTGAKFYPLSTVLPDGTYWEEGTDLTRFTGPLENC